MQINKSAKSQIEIVSKEYIDSIDGIIRTKTNLNHWGNTDTVFTCLKNIENKHISLFIKFDIVHLWASISFLLMNAINFAKYVTPIDDKITKTILHARKSLLFNKKEVWVKKSNPNFDVIVGSFDGAEVCELVRIYLLNVIRKELSYNKIDLYRDEQLSCFQNLSGLESEKIKKNLCKIFKQHELNITVKCNLWIAAS